MIGSSRCPSCKYLSSILFPILTPDPIPPLLVRTREGRLKAAQNLIEFGIDCLAVCGGDGSLTGADMLRKEWPSLVGELLENQRITKVQAETFAHLNIVGLVGSIEYVVMVVVLLRSIVIADDLLHLCLLQQRHGHDRLDHRWIDRPAQDL